MGRTATAPSAVVAGTSVVTWAIGNTVASDDPPYVVELVIGYQDLDPVP